MTTDDPPIPMRGARRFEPFSSARWPRRRLLQWAGTGALLPLLPACGGGDDPPDAEHLAEAIDWGKQAIGQALQSTETSAISVALMTEAGVIWQQAFGMADRAASLAATTQTRFNVGSVSKVVAALAAMILCDRGQLSLDAPIAPSLPGFTMLSQGYRRITLRHLLSHSSGLPGTDARNVFSFAPIPGYAQDGEQGLAYYHLKHEPGELAVYCNDGFTMVELLVLAATGLPYARFVQQEIFTPLGMDRTEIPLQPLASGAYVHAYSGGQRMGQEFVNAHATGGVASTPADMMKLAALFLNEGIHEGRRIVSAAAVREMGRDQSADLRINPSPEWRWGLGWDNVRQLGLAGAGIDAWTKNGGTTFFASEFFVLPRQRMALFISGSSHTYGSLPIAEGILLRALQRTGAIAKLPSPLVLTLPPSASSPPDTAGLEGVFGSSQAPLKVRASGAAVDLLEWKQGAWQPLAQGLTLRTDGWWWSEARSASCYRWIQAGGLDYLMRRSTGGSGHYQYVLPLAQRLAPLATELPAGWRARIGSRWQPINESPESTAPTELQITTLDLLPDLPGYVLWGGTQLLVADSDDHAGMAVKVPGNNGRDLDELHAEMHDGQELLRTGTLLYRRLS